MVEKIKEISAPLQIDSLGDAELPTKVKVQLRKGKSTHKITLEISLAKLRLDRKRCRIDSSSPV